MTMDARKQRVLQAIVALYGLEGEPVGSSVLANYFDMAVSSATLRNEMAALTKLGLLEQPHTSAGRVPSAKGYRYYLDNLLQLVLLLLHCLLMDLPILHSDCLHWCQCHLPYCLLNHLHRQTHYLQYSM